VQAATLDIIFLSLTEVWYCISKMGNEKDSQRQTFYFNNLALKNELEKEKFL